MKREYITYPLMTIAVVIVMSVIAFVLLFASIYAGQVVMKFSGSVGSGEIALSIILPVILVLIAPLFPVYEMIFTFCEKTPYDYPVGADIPAMCLLSDSGQILWSLATIIGVFVFYTILGYVISICKETIFVRSGSQHGFSFRFTDPGRIVRNVWLLIVVAATVALLASLDYIPAGFRGMLYQ